MKLTSFKKLQHYLYLLLFIITSFTFLVHSHSSVLAAGINCRQQEIYIVNGSIVIKQNLTNLPSSLPDYSHAELFDNRGPFQHRVQIASSQNIVSTNPHQGYVIFTIDKYTSQQLANKYGSSKSIDPSLKINEDDVSQCPDIHLTQQQVDYILQGTGNTPPPGACSGGCSDNQSCLWNGSNDINQPNSWSCQTVSFANIDIHGQCGQNKINTALGCLPVNTNDFTASFLTFAVGLAGGIALIIMLIGATLILTGGANPEQTKKGKEIFSSAIMGLLFIIFSTIILKVIMSDILNITI